MPRRMSVWPVAIQTLTPLGIGIIAVSEAQEPAAAPQRPRPGQRARDSRRYAQYRGIAATLTFGCTTVTGMVRSVREDSSCTPGRWLITIALQ